jgi:hypothetical protein
VPSGLVPDLKRRDRVATKQEYQNEMEARLKDLETQIDELMTEATQSDYDEYLADIRSKQEDARAKLAELEEADGESWLALRTEVHQAFSDVEDALFVMRSDSE